MLGAGRGTAREVAEAVRSLRGADAGDVVAMHELAVRLAELWIDPRALTM
jgi:hypothetical protein